MGNRKSTTSAGKFRMAVIASAIAFSLLLVTTIGTAEAATDGAPAIWAGATNSNSSVTVRVDGAHFAAGSSVKVSLDGTQVATATTGPLGEFTSTFHVQKLSGSHTVLATGGVRESSTAFDAASPASIQKLLPRTGVYIALYTNPCIAWADWQKVIDAKNAHPSVPVVVAVNPSSGPGAYKDSGFATGIAKMREAGIIVLGYTYDSYGKRSLDSINADADRYLGWYGVDGLFIDEFTNSAGSEWHYSQITAYAKSIGMKMTMGNPGTDVPASYVGTVDVINITEGPGYMPISWLQYCVSCSSEQGWHHNYDKRNFSYVRYAAGNLDQSFVAESARWAGLVSVTDGVDPGRFFNAPPYLESAPSALDR